MSRGTGDVHSVTHPTWCDLTLCGVWPARDGSTEIMHEVWLLDEYQQGRPHGLVVQLVQYVGLTPSGAVDNVETVVYLDVKDGRVEASQAGEVAAAYALAAELVGYR